MRLHAPDRDRAESATVAGAAAKPCDSSGGRRPFRPVGHAFGRITGFDLIGLFLRECIRGWRGEARAWAEVGVVVTVALAAAGLFEFNFGDTEVFWILLDIFALVIAFTEKTNEPPLSAVPVKSP